MLKLFGKPQETAKTMAQQVTIMLHESKTTADWVITDLDKKIQSKAIDRALSLLPFDQNNKYIVIIPGQDVLLTTATLPQLSPYRRQQALPYALEEQLLDELDTLHFAPGPFSPDQPLPVAVIKKTVLEHWLHILQQQHITPHILIPTTLALPIKNNQWGIGITHDIAHVRTGPYSGFSCDKINLDLLLSLKKIEEKQSPTISQVADLLLAMDIDHYPFINLLQSPYVSSTALKFFSPNKKIWQWVGLAFLSWIILLFLQSLGTDILLYAKHYHRQQQLAALYKRYQLNATTPNVEKMLETILKKTITKKNKILFLDWLDILASISPIVRIEYLHFQPQSIQLEFTAASISDLNEYIAALRSTGLTISQQTTYLSDDQIKAGLFLQRNNE